MGRDHDTHHYSVVGKGGLARPVGFTCKSLSLMWDFTDVFGSENLQSRSTERILRGRWKEIFRTVPGSRELEGSGWEVFFLFKSS